MESIYVGIDVSKGYADIKIIDKNQETVVSSFRLSDTAKGREELGARLLSLLPESAANIYCGVESTGGYENNWYRHLRSISPRIYVTRINPKCVKSNGEAELVRTTTDAVSAQMIATYMVRFEGNSHYFNSDTVVDERFYEGRKLNRYVEQLNKQKTVFNNQLEKVLYEYMPSVINLSRNGVPKWVLNVLHKHSSPKKLVKMGTKRLGRLHGVGEERASKLLSGIKKGVLQCPETASRLIAKLSNKILSLEGEIKEERKYLENTYGDLPGIELLTSIVGIGTQSAVELILEIEDITRFSTAKQLCSYFGLHPVFKQSGDGVFKNRMSKKGRSTVRRVLYMCCLTSIKYSPMMKALYARQKANGKNHYQSIGVLMHKMLRVIFGVLNSQKAYSEAIDEQIRSKAETARKETVTKQDEFELELEATAPISRRKAQKIKKQADVPIE